MIFHNQPYAKNQWMTSRYAHARPNELSASFLDRVIRPAKKRCRRHEDFGFCCIERGSVPG